MINRSELMLNNSVISKCHNGLRTEVRDLSPDSLRLWANPFATYKYEDIDPIPLTPEILEQFGFEVKFHDVFIKGIYDLERVTADEDSPYGFHIYENEIGTTIKYLHQLQNLYFALTGKELEVNLTK